jgi:hypothetical protein
MTPDWLDFYSGLSELVAAMEQHPGQSLTESAFTVHEVASALHSLEKAVMRCEMLRCLIYPVRLANSCSELSSFCFLRLNLLPIQSSSTTIHINNSPKIALPGLTPKHHL